MATLNFRLLGPVEAELDSHQVDLGTPKQKAVLALLLLNANNVVPTEKIIDSVWGDEAPRTADHSVQIYISQLRKALGNGTWSGLIETRAPGYILHAPDDSIDAVRFERLVAEGLSAARTGDTLKGKVLLEKALDIWTADPLVDFVYEEFAQAYTRHLSELHAEAAQTMASIWLDRGNPDEARSNARRAIETDPLREEPHRLMMLALYRSGRQAEALREFGAYKERLGDELGIEPSPELHDLEERILLQDPTLAGAGSVAAPDGNPYRGLRAFSEEDADLYFGREDLVEEVLDRLRDGHGFVSIVGPSGSGKSSAARAGATPVLREAGETVVAFQPGSRPLWELAGALDQAGLGSRASLHRRLETEPDSLAMLVVRPITVIIDQFEEVFTLAEDGEAAQFGQLIARAIRDPRCRLRAITTLRADYYDRPLSMPELAGPFAEATVGVKPMTAQGIERAVVEPARVAGRQVEPTFLAQLVADMVDEPGALPLLQFTLFELYERTDGPLTLNGYQEIGGLHGALARGAEETLAELDPDGQEIAEQLFMRMVRKGKSLPTSRPAPLREVLDLEDDRVALQAVLEAFGSRRLLTFSRDASGAAVVEIAHEYLISEWPQLDEWIEEHSLDLERLVALDAAATEWETHDRSEDYLLRGGRLSETKEWTEATTLRFTGGERAFLKASLDLEKREEGAQREREEREAALARSARRRLWAFGSAVAALAAAVTFLVMALTPDPPPDVVLWTFIQEGTFENLAITAVEAAARENELSTVQEVGFAAIGDIEEFVHRGTPLVIMLGGTFAESSAINQLVVDNPQTRFVWADACPFREPMSHETCILSNHSQMGFLAGTAAALATEARHVGIVVGVDADFMYDFTLGFENGAAHVDPGIEVSSIYLSPAGDLSGFGSPTLGRLGAQMLIVEGADVIFSAAGDSGYGVFDGVAEGATDTGREAWAIGVDIDQYSDLTAQQAEAEEAVLIGGFTWVLPESLEAMQDHILTSIVKNLDIRVEQVVDEFFSTGEIDQIMWNTIENGGIDYTTASGRLIPYVEAMDAAKQAVIEGRVDLPYVSEGAWPDEIRLLGDLIAP